MLKQKDWDDFHRVVASREKRTLRRRCQLVRSAAIDRAKKLSIFFDKEVFTVDMLILKLNNNPYCECCGRELRIEFKKGEKFNDCFPVLHRVCPDKGYTKENIVVFCMRCHKIKGNATIKEMHSLASFINKWEQQQ